MTLTTKDKQQLKAKAHHLKPIVFVGNNGFTENVKNEIERALDDHELIKIRIQESDRVAKKILFAEICKRVLGCPVQLVGGIGVIFRAGQTPPQS